ncbi:hypothetical protein [Methylobacterium platani]|uniref:hypothetical protein n=1 Tax=Methylobacterium platani TaxID=427683 RepID=UPI0012E27F61|nr:hypothetical protein [Methylobacterium platani]
MVWEQCAGAVGAWLSAPWSDPPAIWVGLIGFMAGAVEIVARYKGDPRRALLNLPALLYVTVNVLACLAMLACLRMIEPAWLFADLAGKPNLQTLYLILAAGFGAMTLFRSSLFRIKTADGEIGFGPSALLDTLLFASDRAIDRSVAPPRGSAVQAIMKDVSFERAKIALPVYCFALMQNIPAREQRDLATQVKEIAPLGVPPEVSAANLGLLLMNVVGTDVLKQAVTDLGPYIGYDPLAGDSRTDAIVTLMDGFDVLKAQQLADACINLGRPVPTDGVGELRIRIAQLGVDDIDPRLKALMLGRWLVDLVGPSTVEIALRHLTAASGGGMPPPGGMPGAGAAPPRETIRQMLWRSLARRRRVRDNPRNRR